MTRFTVRSSLRQVHHTERDRCSPLGAAHYRQASPVRRACGRKRRRATTPCSPPALFIQAIALALNHACVDRRTRCDVARWGHDTIGVGLQATAGCVRPHQLLHGRCGDASRRRRNDHCSPFPHAHLPLLARPSRFLSVSLSCVEWRAVRRHDTVDHGWELVKSERHGCFFVPRIGAAKLSTGRRTS